MAVGTLKSNALGFLPDQSPGLSARAFKGREAAGQSFKTGAVVIRSSGKIAIASAGAVADITGVTSGAATGTADREVIMYPVTPDFVFQATLENQSTEDHALVVTNMYTDYGIHVDTNGNFYVNVNETSNTAVCVMAPVNDSDITNATVRARVKVIFLEDTTNWNT